MARLIRISLDSPPTQELITSTSKTSNTIVIFAAILPIVFSMIALGYALSSAPKTSSMVVLAGVVALLTIFIMFSFVENVEVDMTPRQKAHVLTLASKHSLISTYCSKVKDQGRSLKQFEYKQLVEAADWLERANNHGNSLT